MPVFAVIHCDSSGDPKSVICPPLGFRRGKPQINGVWKAALSTIKPKRMLVLVCVCVITSGKDEWTLGKGREGEERGWMKEDRGTGVAQGFL